MTQPIDEPEIVLGGDPAPSAPGDDPEIVMGRIDDASATSAPSAPPTATSWATTLPTAYATAPVATPVGEAQPLRPAGAAATTTSSGGAIERTANADGSLSVKITTTTPQANGYREVKIEHFTIPAGMASVVGMSLDNGDPPSSLYMARMEQQILPPGTGAVISSPPEPTPATAYPIPGDTAAATTGGWNYAANNAQQQNTGSPEPTPAAAYPTPGDTAAATTGGWNYAANNAQQQNTGARVTLQVAHASVIAFAGICCIWLVIAAVDTYDSSPSYPSPYYTPYPVYSPYTPSYPTPNWDPSAPRNWNTPYTPSYPTPGSSNSPTYWWQKVSPRPTYPPWTRSPEWAPFFPPPSSTSGIVSPTKPGDSSGSTISNVEKDDDASSDDGVDVGNNDSAVVD